MQRQKKNLLNLAAGNRTQHIQRYLWSRFEVITTKQNNTSIADFFKIQSSYSPTPSHGKPEKKSVEPRSREQSTAYSELSFKLGSRLSLQFWKKVLLCTQNVGTKVFLRIQFFEQKSCFASNMFEQKSCFEPKIFEQNSCLAPHRLKKSLASHP